VTVPSSPNLIFTGFFYKLVSLLMIVKVESRTVAAVESTGEDTDVLGFSFSLSPFLLSDF